MTLRRRYRHFNRYKEIANIMAKHGLGYFLDHLGLREHLPGTNPSLEKGKSRLSAPQRVASALEELGPTFVKLGQMLSSRPDLVPAEYIEELERLQDQVQPLPSQDILRIIEEEQGKGVEELFKQFEEEPLASASIGQVHMATLTSGKQVVVKVQRPSIESIIDVDLEILFDLAHIVETRTNWGALIRPVDLVQELARHLRDELEYILEGHNAERMARNFAQNSDIVIPEIYWELTTRRVLVMEYVEGIKISAKEKLFQAGIDTGTVAKKIIQAMLKQIFEDGFFHADPHPGNIAVQPGEKIVFMDFGQMGRTDPLTRERAIGLLLAMIRYDAEEVVNNIARIGEVVGRLDMKGLRRDVGRLQAKYYEIPLSQIKLKESLQELLDLSYKYQIRLPADLVLIVKAFITLEGLVQNLDPGLSIIDIAEPFGKQLLRNRLSPRHIRRFLLEHASELGRTLTNIPRKLERALDRLEDGQVKIELEHRNLRHLLRRLDLVSNRIAISIVIASIIIGSSLITQGTTGSILRHYPVAEGGFVIAVLLGLGLIFSIFRSGRY